MFLCVYCCFIGQPHSHPSHPDYIPSVFPAENKLLSHKRSEQDISRWHRRMERLARQAKRQMKETEEDQERKERLRAEKRRLKKEEKRCQTEERKCQDEEKVREIEQQRIQEEEMHLEMEKQVKLLKEKMGKLEENRDQLKKKTLETQKEWCQVEKYIRQVKKEIHDLESKLECQCDEDEPIFPITVVHTQQQTDETGEMLEKCLKENAQLREKLASQTCGVSMIKENNEIVLKLCTFQVYHATGTMSPTLNNLGETLHWASFKRDHAPQTCPLVGLKLTISWVCVQTLSTVVVSASSLYPSTSQSLMPTPW